jgi:hypothetical protein
VQRAALRRTALWESPEHRSDKSLTELAQMYNPCSRGWIIYYSHFYKTQLRPTLKRIDAYVIRWPCFATCTRVRASWGFT